MSTAAVTSRQWLARLALAFTLAASEVVVAGLNGVTGLRLIVVAAAAVAFVSGYLVTPSAGKREYDRTIR